MSIPADYVDRIDREGFAVANGCLTASEICTLRAAIEAAPCAGNPASIVQSRGTVFAIRNLLAIVPEAAELIQHASVRDLVGPILGSNAFAVRGILFDKTPGANWGLLWHQDLSVAVRTNSAESEPQPVRLSSKGGVPHFDAPADVLRNMLTLRFHLDDASDETGALRVIAGSHRHGRLNAAQIERFREQGPIFTCTAGAGGVVALRPLLLHSSPRALRPERRRVIHLEFAAATLPEPFDWWERRSIGPRASADPSQIR